MNKIYRVSKVNFGHYECESWEHGQKKILMNHVKCCNELSKYISSSYVTRSSNYNVTYSKNFTLIVKEDSNFIGNFVILVEAQVNLSSYSYCNQNKPWGTLSSGLTIIQH